MNLHELKDIVTIYSCNEQGKPDNSWERAKITIWNPNEQREMDLVFTGSDRGGCDENTPSENRKINFNVQYVDPDRKDIFDAYNNALKKIFPNIDDSTLKEYSKVFLQELLNLRK